MNIVPNKRLCVYTHSADGKIFYVGQGQSHRPYERYNRTPRWHAHVEESGGGYEVAIHCWVDDKAEALRIERELVEAHAPPCNGHHGPELVSLVMEPMQCRAARGLLQWTQKELGAKARVSDMTIRQFELGATEPMRATLDALQRAFEKAGVEFIEDDGVRMKRRRR